MNLLELDKLRSDIKKHPWRTLISLIVLVVFWVVATTGIGYFSKKGEQFAEVKETDKENKPNPGRVSHPGETNTNTTDSVRETPSPSEASVKPPSQPDAAQKSPTVFTLEKGAPQFIESIEATLSINFATREGLSFARLIVSPKKGKATTKFIKAGELVEMDEFYINVLEVDYDQENGEFGISKK